MEPTVTPAEGSGQNQHRSWSDRLLTACARETSAGRLIPQVDGLRFIAVMAVVCFHLDAQLGRPVTTSLLDRCVFALVRRGFLGVPLFFAISAFIVALPYANHHLNGGRKPTLGNFFLRRLTRLEPPYFFNLIVLWLLSYLISGAPLVDRIPNLLASLVYQHNQTFDHFSTINAAAWSLEVEFQFYLLAPALTFLFAIPNQWIRWLILAGAVLAVGALRNVTNERIHLSLPGSFEYFAAGFISVDVYLSRWKATLPNWIGWDLAALVGWTGFLFLNELAATTHGALLHSACLTLAFLGSLGGTVLPRFLANRWIFTVGGMCYTIYLWHQWLMQSYAPSLNHWLGPTQNHVGRFLLIATVSIPPMLAVCTLLFLWVEKPFMRRDWPTRVAAWFRRPTSP